MYGIDFLNRRPAVVDFIHLVTIVVVATLIIWWYTTGTVYPLYDALECACLSKGENCRETHRFSYDFWYKYWKTDVPAVFAAVDKLKAGGFVETGTALVQTANRMANLLSRQ